LEYFAIIQVCTKQQRIISFSFVRLYEMHHFKYPFSVAHLWMARACSIIFIIPRSPEQRTKGFSRREGETVFHLTSKLHDC
jgi:hypothetical protein